MIVARDGSLTPRESEFPYAMVEKRRKRRKSSEPKPRPRIVGVDRLRPPPLWPAQRRRQLPPDGASLFCDETWNWSGLTPPRWHPRSDHRVILPLLRFAFKE
jgi:hypothetical protein